jgi:hypothetical protein
VGLERQRSREAYEEDYYATYGMGRGTRIQYNYGGVGVIQLCFSMLRSVIVKTRIPVGF